MTLHEKGVKAERDRAILITSYEVMCDEFRLPSSKRLTRANMAMMSNKVLYQASKDVYSQATVKQAKKLAIKMGLKDSWYQENIGKYIDKKIQDIKDWFMIRKVRRS